MPVTDIAAQTVALNCLGWLAENDELWSVFLGSTGAVEADLRGRADDPELLAAVLDFVLMDDAWVRDCCAARGVEPQALAHARAALPGGAQVSWT